MISSLDIKTVDLPGADSNCRMCRRPIAEADLHCVVGSQGVELLHKGCWSLMDGLFEVWNLGLGDGPGDVAVLEGLRRYLGELVRSLGGVDWVGLEGGQGTAQLSENP